MRARLWSWPARLAGVDPCRVAGLADGLQREARGQLVLRHEQEGKRGMSPNTGRILLLIFLALGSVGLGVAAGALAARPWIMTSLLIFAQGGAVFFYSASEVMPLVLGAEDHRHMGWWPVSERELLLARLGVVMQSVLEATAVMTTIPLIVLAVTGNPPVVPMIGAMVGLLLHAVTLSTVMVLLTQGLGRLLGRRNARRLVEVMGTIVVVILIQVLMRSIEAASEHLESLSPWLFMLIPTAWYGAWGGLAQASSPVLIGAAASLVATTILYVIGIRVLGRVGAEEDARPVARRSTDRWTGWLASWAGLFLRGRDGRALRLLLIAHLREDWRFTGSLLFMPVMLLLYLLIIGRSDIGPLEPGLAGAAQVATGLGLWMSFLALSLGASTTCSVEAEASWLVRGGVISGPRMLSLQRRLIRCLLPGPLLFLFTLGLVIWGGLSPWLAPLAAAPAWMAFEICLTFVQSTLPAAPFSRFWRRDGHGFRVYNLILVVIWPLAMLPVILVYGLFWWAPMVVLAGQGLVLWGMRALLSHRVRTVGVFGVAPRTE